MAIRANVRLATPWIGHIEIHRWTGLTNGDEGAPLNLPNFGDKSVHVEGTFGNGGTLIIEGSNYKETESPPFRPLVDPHQNAISITEVGIEQVLGCTYLIRPRVTAGDGTTDLTVTIMGRK